MFKKQTGMAPNRGAASAAAADPAMPDVEWLLDERGEVDCDELPDWRDEDRQLLADLRQWAARHERESADETARRVAAIERAAGDLLAAFPGVRTPPRYVAVAVEDWSGHDAAVILATVRRLRRTLRAVPSIAAVRAELERASRQLRAALYHLERHLPVGESQ